MANPLSALKNFFTNVWKAIKKVVPDEQLQYALALVKVAATKFVDNEARRNFVVAELMKQFKIPESLARWLTETAVQMLKHAIEVA